MATEKKRSQKNVVVGVAISAAAAAAAAGAYWLYGSKHATKHRRQVQDWMVQARSEVKRAIGKLKRIDKETYLEIVKNAVARYKKLSRVSARDAAKMMQDLNSAWAEMSRRSTVSRAKGAAKTVKRIVRKSAQKIEDAGRGETKK